MDPAPHPSVPVSSTRITRRRALAGAAAAGATVWAAPAVLSFDAVAAASGQPPNQSGGLFGLVITCQREPDPGEAWEVRVGGPTGFSTTTAKNGAYSLSSLPVGTYTVELHPNGPDNSGQPDESFGSVTINDGANTELNMDYQANGC